MMSTQQQEQQEQTVTVILTGEATLLSRYGGAQTRFVIGTDTVIDLPDEKKQRTGFTMEITAARKLIQVCPLYKLKTTKGRSN